MTINEFNLILRDFTGGADEERIDEFVDYIESIKKWWLEENQSATSLEVWEWLGSRYENFIQDLGSEWPY